MPLHKSYTIGATAASTVASTHSSATRAGGATYAGGRRARGARASLTALALALVASTTAWAQETITFPSRASDLASDAYWVLDSSDEGCCILDLTVMQWNGTRWVDGEVLATNAGYYTWDVPLYAPANGVIASCWRNFPDDPRPGVQPPNNNIFGGGNHVVILTDQGNAISMNHLQSGTIPAELCPANADTTPYPPTMQKQGYWRTAAYVAPADRPRVTEGDYIGRAGNSGSSSNPHLHMDMRPLLGTDGWGREAIGSASPLQFRDAWAHPYARNAHDTPAGWYRLRGGDFTADPACPSCTATMVSPSPYLRRASASTGAVRGVDTVFLSANRAVTAVIDSHSMLKLIAWNVVGLGDLVRKGEISAGAVKEAQLVEVASDYLLVAVRTPTDDLKMIAYHVTFLGSFTRLADSTAGKIRALALGATSGPDIKAVTAVREQSGDLKVIVWDLDFAHDGTASVVRLGSRSAGPVSALAIARASNFRGVFTAVRDRGNVLKVIPWRISLDGMTVTRGTDASAGTVGTQIAVAPLVQGVAAAVRDSAGKLRLITWTVSSHGNIGTRRDAAVAGSVTEIGLLGTPLGGSNLTTFVRDSTGDMLLIGWLVNTNGTNVRRAGSSRAGAATTIAADSVYRTYPGKDPRDMLLTAMRDSAGELKLITWDTNLVNP